MVVDGFSDLMLENIACCPACGGVGCAKSYLSKDVLFGSSDRQWKHCMCEDCKSIYLSTRPKEQYISIAYQAYYTHSIPVSSEMTKQSTVRKLLKSYVQSIHSSKFKHRVGHLLLRLFFPLREFFDAKARHISGVLPGRILDFGCGNGEFLKLAKSLGWGAVGYDLDSNAVECSKGQGLDVKQGGLEALSAENDATYDLITLSHVIEHVYEPEVLLAECFRLLKPGGRLWLETPNSMSTGLKLYKQHWRGLEPPRHILIPNYIVMNELLLKQGFSSVCERRHALAGFYMSIKSELIQYQSEYGVEARKLPVTKIIRAITRGILIEVVQSVFKRRSEFVTIYAEKS